MAIVGGRGMAYICLAGGEYATSSAAYLEPPRSIILGDSGGQGLMSTVIDEIFKNKKSPSYPVKKTLHSQYTGPHSYPVVAAEPSSGDYIIFSAVVICDGVVIDLLGSPFQQSATSKLNPSSRGQKAKPCKVGRNSDGSYHLANVTRLQLRSVADFERIAGVLLGRRAALREIAPLLRELGADSLSNVAFPDTPWLLSSEHEASILFSVTTTGEGVSVSSHGNINFHFTCPCGVHWAVPGGIIFIIFAATAKKFISLPILIPQDRRYVCLQKLSLPCLTPLRPRCSKQGY
jgi:hypothetical protein